MALVPSGKSRVMVGQLFRGAQSLDEEPTERDSVQQQQLSGTESSPDAAKSTATPTVAPVAPQAVAPQAVQPQKDEQIAKVDTSKMKKHYFQVLQEAGVQVRAIDPENRNKFFTRGGNPNDGSASGTFLVPSRMSVDGQDVSDAEVQEIAKKVIAPFKGVQITNWTETKGGYRFDWHNKNEMNTGLTGTSFDELLGDGKKNKAASTIGEMLQSRRDELYTTMRKIAKGEK